jgi:hypothetical protein
MLRRLGWTAASLIAPVVLYFALWPVPIQPVAWAAPPNHGYTGPLAPNERMKGIETLPIADNQGPEDVAIGPDGRIYASTQEGRIVRLRPDGAGVTRPTFSSTSNSTLSDSKKTLLPAWRSRSESALRCGW